MVAGVPTFPPIPRFPNHKVTIYALDTQYSEQATMVAPAHYSLSTDLVTSLRWHPTKSYLGKSPCFPSDFNQWGWIVCTRDPPFQHLVSLVCGRVQSADHDLQVRLQEISASLLQAFCAETLLPLQGSYQAGSMVVLFLRLIILVQECSLAVCLKCGVMCFTCYLIAVLFGTLSRLPKYYNVMYSEQACIFVH